MDVSIIIPVYNTGKYLNRAIDSVLNQKTKYSFEIIVVDDKSTDNSIQLLELYKNKIKLIKKEKNTGPGDTRNIGIREAKGKYLLFVDSDDEVKSNFVEVMVSNIINNNCDLVVCNFFRVFPNKVIPEDKGKKGIYEKEDIKNILLMDFHSWNKCFKREIFMDVMYPLDMVFEDVVAVFRYIVRCKKIIKIDDYLINYIERKNSITDVIDKTNFDLLKAFDMIRDEIKNNYYDELEYLYIDNILVDLLIKIVKSKSDNKKESFYQIKNKIINYYPRWYKNKYIKDMRIVKKLYLLCLKLDLYCIINLVFKS